MPKIQSNMRLMEFLVDYVHSSSACENFTPEDETCITFTYLNYFQIRVKQSEYESSQYTKSKNCLFTTHDNESSEENQIIAKIYKMCSSEGIYIGYSTINLESVFKKSFAPDQTIIIHGSNSSLQVNEDSPQYPLTESTRLILPILNDEDLTIGTLNVQVSVSTFGPSLVYQSPLHALVAMEEFQETPAGTDCLQENNQNSSTCNAVCSYGPMNPSENLQLNSQNLSPNDDGIPLVPPASKNSIEAPEKEYEEFCAEVNDNVLIVRVTKANRKVTRVCEEMESCENDYPCKYHITNLNMKCSDDGDNLIVEVPNARGKYTNSCGIPAINGNLKYPAKFCTTYPMSACTDVPEKRTVLRPSTVCFPCKHIELDDIHATDCGEAGVEVCKKGCQNPNCDVFVIRLGKTNGGQSEIELELRTPKSPTAQMPVITQTAQTYEEEFNEEYNGNKQGKASGKGKKK